MDYVLVLLFLAILLMGISTHLDARRKERKFVAEVTQNELLTREMKQLRNSEREEATKRELRLREELQRAGASREASTTPGTPMGGGEEIETITPATSAGGVGDVGALPETLQVATTASYPRFLDVTAVRYENARLGFVMEIPKGWYLAYEYGQDLAFGSDLYAFGITFEDMKKPNGALWMRVTRPCSSTPATSTIFAFATSSDLTIREASSCIPPFLVTLGYRADAPSPYAREQFLLNLGRTFYPIVSPTAPYAPIR